MLYKRFENGKLTWPSNENEVKALSSEQVDWLMKGFAITPKINPTKRRDFYGNHGFSFGIIKINGDEKPYAITRKHY